MYKFCIILVITINLLLNYNLVAGSKAKYVTCGSVVKLINNDYKTRLHSHDVKYGSGSGQQSVTATEIQEDVNSHWAIRAITGKVCERGAPVKCGDLIRLHHISTNKNLHSHNFMSPLSGNQEISCYGDEHGEGDTGDHWEVICTGDAWLRDSSIKFRHVDTEVYLSISGRTFGRPINGQMEVIGIPQSYSSTDWKTAEGLFIHPTEEKDSSPLRDEL